MAAACTCSLFKRGRWNAKRLFVELQKEQHRQYIQLIGLTLYSFLAKTRSVKRQLSINKKTNTTKRTQ